MDVGQYIEEQLQDSESLEKSSGVFLVDTAEKWNPMVENVMYRVATFQLGTLGIANVFPTLTPLRQGHHRKELDS
jgi:hypothetical protein